MLEPGIALFACSSKRAPNHTTNSSLATIAKASAGFTSGLASQRVNSGSFMSTLLVEARMFIYNELYFFKHLLSCDHWLKYCAHIHATVSEILPEENSDSTSNEFLGAVTAMKELLDTSKGSQFLEACAFLDKTHEQSRHSNDVTKHIEIFLGFLVDTETLVPLAQTIAKFAARLWHGSIWFHL